MFDIDLSSSVSGFDIELSPNSIAGIVYVKIAGVFELCPILVKIAGAFIEKTPAVKTGGSF